MSPPENAGEEGARFTGDDSNGCLLMSFKRLPAISLTKLISKIHCMVRSKNTPTD